MIYYNSTAHLHVMNPNPGDAMNRNHGDAIHRVSVSIHRVPIPHPICIIMFFINDHNNMNMIWHDDIYI